MVPLAAVVAAVVMDGLESISDNETDVDTGEDVRMILLDADVLFKCDIDVDDWDKVVKDVVDIDIDNIDDVSADDLDGSVVGCEDTFSEWFVLLVDPIGDGTAECVDEDDADENGKMVDDGFTDLLTVDDVSVAVGAIDGGVVSRDFC